MLLENNKSLLKLNTFGVNCYAENFISIKNKQDIQESIHFINKNEKNHFVLGGGSNILLTKNIEGVVLHNQIDGINILKEEKEHIIINVGSGVIWNDLVKWSIKNKLWGIENLILIPGTVGAAPIQNIGAYGVEIKDVFENLNAYSIKTGEKINFSKKQCLFGYRESVFKNELKNELFISDIQIKLKKIKSPILNYETLRFKLEKKQTPITIKNIATAICEIRNSKLPNPKKIGNSGSFFKNPIIEKNLFEKIKKSFPEIKYFKKNGKTKVSAGWLIEKTGWKGKKIKDCGVYEKQALVLINFGNANGYEIKELAEKIKNDVKNTFGIELEEEVQII
mgnify:FL=1